MAPFWEALDAGRLTTTRCRACAHLTFPPKVLCPACWDRDLEWVGLAGRGRLASFTEVCVAPSYFVAEAPYVLGLVDLEEGVRVLSRVQAPFDELAVDQLVELVVRRARPVSLFEFRPCAQEGER
ncbi:MAG: Zn-ribbon domain-containing OB-fold protein [bacterium]|jgi:uncharacterized OB-fold protein|nr:Zn-ribbon domain-containing OB-fold protein [bacterium]